MLELILTLIPTLGSAGAGSILKMLGGFVQEWAAARSLEKREKLALIMQSRAADRAADAEFQKAVFGANNEDSRSSLLTRRILAIMGMSIFGGIAFIATGHPEVGLLTFTPPESNGGETSLLFGLISWPKSVPLVSTVTMGHVVIMQTNALVMILAFYFTPGGRK